MQPPSPNALPRRWHLVCQVIDNFGDVGVLWRLARQLADEYGCRIDFFIDDIEALHKLAPHTRGQKPSAGPHRRVDPLACIRIHRLHADAPIGRQADVVILGFQVRLPEAARRHLLHLQECRQTIERHQRPANPGSNAPVDTRPDRETAAYPSPHAKASFRPPPDAGTPLPSCDPRTETPLPRSPAPPPLLIQLDYLSAESWVEGCHGLASLHPDGLREYFFHPGFGPATGGLLRERSLPAWRDAFLADPAARWQWLASLGIRPQPDERLVGLLCYRQAPLRALLDAWLANPALTGGRRLHLLAPGADTQPHLPAAGELEAASGGRIKLSRLPFLPQPEFDPLLWSCDLNLVRGEDSWIRALWAGRPWLWQAYPQDEDAHLIKLDAFLRAAAQAMMSSSTDSSATDLAVKPAVEEPAPHRPPPISSRQSPAAFSTPPPPCADTGVQAPAQSLVDPAHACTRANIQHDTDTADLRHWQRAMRAWNRVPGHPVEDILLWLSDPQRATATCRRLSVAMSAGSADLASRLTAFVMRHTRSCEMPSSPRSADSPCSNRPWQAQDTRA
ncbi:MAG: elongation factor P maturation arginine rhamnosyltransferase EarP [Lautropia sp.]|nr:elongation factor P maturation arginine rhamnosyltransferase EarP [Lautropia sp.]